MYYTQYTPKTYIKSLMKPFLIICALIILAATCANAQTREVDGTVIDSTKLSVIGAIVKCKGNAGDSTLTATDVNGKFTFPSVKGPKFTLYISSLGYQGIIKHFTMDNAATPIVLGNIILKAESNQLKMVTITASLPVTFKEDTIEYNASDYKVRENAPIEDVIKKLPGVDVDANGNVTAQGQQVTKVRINGKDFFGGDVQTATKNLPADVVESIQMIDDYGDQANLTGVKTGEPNKIMNITIRKDKNYGYFGQATAGDGSDDIPANTGTDQNRYVGLINIFDFNDQQQIAVLGNLNNTNVNTFNFSQAGAPAVGGSFGGGGGGGGGAGRGNALRGGGVQTGLATTANGITNARSIGTNYRDQWGKYISVYGSYSFSDNTTYTFGNTLQQNNFQVPSSTSQENNEHDNPINHRFTLNIEYKPDTINYLKLTPTFSYASTNTTETELDSSLRSNALQSIDKSSTVTTSTAPTFGLIALYNHRFPHRRNLSDNVSVTTTQTNTYDNPINNYILGPVSGPNNQIINTNNSTTTFSNTLSYLEPLGKLSYLELNYAYNHSYTSNDKQTDTLSDAGSLDYYNRLSNNYQFTFITNKIGLNYRFIQKKYNYTLGLSVLPATLDGESLTNDIPTHASTFNVVPTAHFVYNFSRSHTLNINFDGTSTQPTFNELQPVIDYSNALYPVEGNPNLKPSYSNNLTIRYNEFSFGTGNLLFTTLKLTETENQITPITVTYPESFASGLTTTNPQLKYLENTNLTEYQNSNGYYNALANVTYAKPWDNRRYTLILTANVTYTRTAAYSTSVDSNNVQGPIEYDISKAWVYTPSARFRVDITDVIDAQASTTFSEASTDNSIKTGIFGENTNIRALTLAVTGKNYVWKDWTFSYDYSKIYNYGNSIPTPNPNVLNVYVERRFLKDYRGTIRLSAFDLFNENTGFTTTTNGAITTQTNVNRLGRYYLATFTFRLQKFAGKAPGQNNRRGGFGGPGGGPGGPGGGPGGGGPGGGF